MSFYCLVWLWRQLIEVRVLRTWKHSARTSATFFCSLMKPPLSFKTIRSLWKDCFFLDEIYGLIVFQIFFGSECLSSQILEKWSLTLFLLMLTSLFLSWRYFSQSSGFLDLLNCLLERFRSLITSRNSGFINWNWSRCCRRNDLTGAWSFRSSTNNFSQVQYTSSGSSKT